MEAVMQICQHVSAAVFLVKNPNVDLGKPSKLLQTENIHKTLKKKQC